MDDGTRVALLILLQPTLRRHHTKLVLADEWAESIVESHPPSPERDAALQTHHHEVQLIRRALSGQLQKIGVPPDYSDPLDLARRAGYPLEGEAAAASPGLVAWF